MKSLISVKKKKSDLYPPWGRLTLQVFKMWTLALGQIYLVNKFCKNVLLWSVFLLLLT